MIIVTGGAGFIGSAVIAALNSRGEHDILVVDRLGTDEKWKNLVGLRFADYIEADAFLEDVRENKLPLGIDAVIHEGAISTTTERDASLLATNNFEYTKTLASWAVNRNIRFIYASSAATYGDGSEGFEDDESQLYTLQPLNMYGYSKHMFDQWAKQHGMLKKIAGLKYFNVFGPNEYHKADMRSFILKSFEQIKANGKVQLFKSGDPNYADGEYVRDFVYVKDAVAMTLFFLDHPEVNGLFNVGTGQARSWNDMVTSVFRAMGKQPKIEYVSMPDSLASQYQYYTQADISKIQNAGYKQSITSLEDAVTDYVQNYLEQHEYLTRI